MLNSKTVFVLGAGASFEVGFPLGSKLRETISHKLNFKRDSIGRLTKSGEMNIAERLKQKFPSKYDEYINVCSQISNGILLSDSIDDFIDKHRHDDRVAICGKLAIAFSIIEAENQSKIFVDPSNSYNTIQFQSLGDNWYTKFYSLLTKGIPKSDLGNVFENLTIINFNYDRSLEHFLVHAISKDYIIEKNEATDLVNNLIVFRPYGSISHNVKFGNNRLPDLDNIITNLRTYTEKVEEGIELNQVRNAIKECNSIVFLGMAYHINNMTLLKCECDMRRKTIYATRKGISDHDIPVVKHRILSLSDHDTIGEIDAMLELSDRDVNNIFFSQDCRDLFDDYRLSLSEL